MQKNLVLLTVTIAILAVAITSAIFLFDKEPSHVKSIEIPSVSIGYIGKFIINPTKATEEIAEDNLGLWAGFWWVTLFCFGYSVTAFIGYMLGYTPTATWLSIPLEKWYLVQTFTTIPIGLAGALSYSGLAYIFCKAIGGKGTFDATFASQAFTLHIPCFIFMWIPETFLLPIFSVNIHSVPWLQWIEILRVFITKHGKRPSENQFR